MKKIKNLDEAIKIFEESTIVHGESADGGDYKTGNKASNKIQKAINYLKEHNQVLELKRFLTHKAVGPRGWAAFELLPFLEEESIKVLTSISEGMGSNAFSAEYILKEWAKPDSELRQRLMAQLKGKK